MTESPTHELQRLMGIKLLLLISFHPQTDGVTKRANHLIGQILQSMVNVD